MQVTTREATLKDALTIAQLSYDSFNTQKEWVGEAFEEKPLKTWQAEWQQQLLGKGFDAACLVAIYKDKIVGFIFFEQAYENYFDSPKGPPILGRAQICTIGVDPKYFGQRIAAHLLQDSYLLMQERNYISVQLWTATQNQPARKLYQREGFKDTKDRINFTRGSLSIENLRYQRDLLATLPKLALDYRE